MKLSTFGFEWLDCKYIFDPKTIVRNQQWTVEIKIRPTIEIKTRPELDEPTKTAFALFDVEIVWKCENAAKIGGKSPETALTLFDVVWKFECVTL